MYSTNGRSVGRFGTKDNRRIKMASEQEKECCATCKFWNRHSDDPKYMGACRCHAPRPVENVTDDWPPTPAGQWCGDFTAIIKTWDERCKRYDWLESTMVSVQDALIVLKREAPNSFGFDTKSRIQQILDRIGPYEK